MSELWPQVLSCVLCVVSVSLCFLVKRMTKRNEALRDEIKRTTQGVVDRWWKGEGDALPKDSAMRETAEHNWPKSEDLD